MIDIRALEKNEFNSFMNQPFETGYRLSLKGRGYHPSAILTYISAPSGRSFTAF